MATGNVSFLPTCPGPCREIMEGDEAVQGRMELLSSVFCKMLPHMILSEERILNLTSYTSFFKAIMLSKQDKIQLLA